MSAKLRVSWVEYLRLDLIAYLRQIVNAREFIEVVGVESMLVRVLRRGICVTSERASHCLMQLGGMAGVW